MSSPVLSPGAEFVAGTTEPWVQDLLVALLFALQRDNPTVLECGGFLGSTSALLASALQEGGGGTLIVAEYDPEAPERAMKIWQRLNAMNLFDVAHTVRQEDALTVIRSLPDASLDLAYLDDDHTAQHVHDEILALWPKMKPNGIIAGHDVYGVCDLQAVFRSFGGYALDLPRLGPAGGLGILQVP